MIDAKMSPNGKHLSPQQRTEQKQTQQKQQRRQGQLQPTAAPVATTPATEATVDAGAAAAPAGTAGDVTAGTAGAAAVAATTGAAEAEAGRPGPEKRHIDDVTPGESLEPRTRAREWAEGSEEDDSEMSVEEEEEDSAEEDSEVAQKAGASRAMWVKDDVSALRDADLASLQRHNDALYASVVGLKEERSSTCLAIFPQEQSKEGVDRFKGRRIVRVTLRRLRCTGEKSFNSELKGGKTVHYLVLRFASKTQAEAARDRIMEEHRGGAWPPFVVAFAFHSTMRYMEQLVETRTPGAGRDPLPQ